MWFKAHLLCLRPLRHRQTRNKKDGWFGLVLRRRGLHGRESIAVSEDAILKTTLDLTLGLIPAGRSLCVQGPTAHGDASWVNQACGVSASDPEVRPMVRRVPMKLRLGPQCTLTCALESFSKVLHRRNSYT